VLGASALDGQQVSDVQCADELSWARLGSQVVEELARQGFAQQAVQAALDATEAKVVPRSRIAPPLALHPCCGHAATIRAPRLGFCSAASLGAPLRFAGPTALPSGRPQGRARGDFAQPFNEQKRRAGQRALEHLLLHTPEAELPRAFQHGPPRRAPAGRAAAGEPPASGAAPGFRCGAARVCWHHMSPCSPLVFVLAPSMLEALQVSECCHRGFPPRL